MENLSSTAARQGMTAKSAWLPKTPITNTAARAESIVAWMKTQGGHATIQQPTDSNGDYIILIETTRGVVTASPEEWVILGSHGEFYSYNPRTNTSNHGPAAYVEPTDQGE